MLLITHPVGLLGTQQAVPQFAITTSLTTWFAKQAQLVWPSEAAAAAAAQRAKPSLNVTAMVLH